MVRTKSPCSKQLPKLAGKEVNAVSATAILSFMWAACMAVKSNVQSNQKWHIKNLPYLENIRQPVDESEVWVGQYVMNLALELEVMHAPHCGLDLDQGHELHVPQSSQHMVKLAASAATFPVRAENSCTCRKVSRVGRDNTQCTRNRLPLITR